MKITQSKTIEQQTSLNINLTTNELEPYIDHGYRKMVMRVKIPGFRKGTAPRKIVESLFGKDALLKESIDFLLTDTTEKAIKEKDLILGGTPSVELLDLSPPKIKVTVPLYPDINLGEYLKIEIPKIDNTIKKKDVDLRIKELQKSVAPWNPISKTAKYNNMLSINIDATVENQPIINEKNVNYILDKESLLPVPGFSKNLLGATSGDFKEFKLQVPSDNPNNNIAGKEASFGVKINEVKEQILPKLDDEFAKSINNKFNTLEELQSELKKEMELESKNAEISQYRESALDALLKTVKIIIPPLLIEREIQNLTDRRDVFIKKMNMNINDYLKYIGKTEEDVTKEMRENSIEKLTRSYSLVALAEAEKINITQEEINNQFEELKKNPGKDNITKKKLNTNQKNQIENVIRENLLVEKALERLIEIATKNQ